MQRVADSWRSPIGSTAIIVLIAFFEDNSYNFPTDEDRQEWAGWYLKHYRFAYKQSNGDDPKVCVRWFRSSITNYFIQKFKGTLRGLLVLQTLGAHFNAVAGAQKLQGVDDPERPVGKPIGALGLAAAAVSTSLSYITLLTYSVLQAERALTLVQTGVISMHSIAIANGKCPTLPKTVNTTTGKESTISVAFNDDGWGKATRAFTKSAARVLQSVHQFEKIERSAKEFSKTNPRVLESSAGDAPEDMLEDDDDERANLVNNGSGDEEDQED